MPQWGLSLCGKNMISTNTVLLPHTSWKSIKAEKTWDSPVLQQTASWLSVSSHPELKPIGKQGPGLKGKP